MTERRKRHDGTEIDPVKSLADFVQSYEPSAQDAPAADAPPVAAAPPTPEVADEYAGKTPAEIIAEAKANRERAEKFEIEAKSANEKLILQQRQSEIESTARRIMAEQQRQATPAAPPTPEAPDPRVSKIDELWWTDPAAARQLMAELNDERLQKRLDEQRETTKREVFADLTKQQLEQRAAEDRKAGNNAFDTAMTRLRAAGVPEADLANRYKITGLYTAVTLKPTPEAPNPYYTDGGPLNPDVLERAWRDLYGTGMPPAPAPVPTVPIIAPPGSSRPAPAAAPPSQVRAAPISADIRRDYEYLAKSAGLDPEKMLARRQARIAREGK